MTEIVLFLDDTIDRVIHSFNSTDGLEAFLPPIHLEDYAYTPIIVYTEKQPNFKLSKIYKLRYL
jgi:hypothetical protein